MACILKFPTETSGVISFTTQEEDKLFNPRYGGSEEAARRAFSLKTKNWKIGCHHNWHNYEFRYNGFYDFHMAGYGDLGNDSTTPLIPLDACNFSPREFSSQNYQHKFWDIIYVTRAVTFKRIPLFFNTIKKLYSMKKKYRVLLLISLPDEDRDPSNFFELYNQIFTREERELLTVIAPEHDYPFPYDKPTLAHFYNSSKVFAHFAPDERRCRVIAYASAAGLPVVASKDCLSILPSALQNSPYCFEVSNDDEYAHKLIEAVEAADSSNLDMHSVVDYFNYDNATHELVAQLTKLFNEPFDIDEFNLHDLDHRLGRHQGISLGSNKVSGNIVDFISALYNDEIKNNYLSQKDLEEWISARYLQ